MGTRGGYVHYLDGDDGFTGVHTSKLIKLYALDILLYICETGTSAMSQH